MAYAESLAAVSYINDSYGMGDIQRILQRLSEGSSTEAALRATIHSDYGQLESDLAKYLSDKYGELTSRSIAIDPLHDSICPPSPLVLVSTF